MKVKRSFGAALAGGCLRLRGLLPLKYHRFWARIIAWILQHVFHYRAGVVKTNLARSFPEKQYSELDAIQNRFYRQFASIFTEMVWYSACRGNWGRKRLHKSHIVEFTNPEEFNRLYGSAPQMMLLLGHTGNWELISGAFYYSYGKPLEFTPQMVTVAHHGIHSPLWNQVMEEVRTAPIRDLGFDGYVSTDGILRHALTHKGERKVYIFITDQYPYVRSGSQSLNFMHQETRTMTGAAALASKLGMSVGYVRYRCREDGGYTMTLVPLTDNASGENPATLMQNYYKLLEEDLRAQPWNYLWTHKRWKQVV